MVSKIMRAGAVILLLVSLFLAGCGKKERAEEKAGPQSGLASAEVLFEVDCEFGSMAIDSGLAASFTYFAADSGTVFRDGSHPITGKEAIGALFPQPSRGTLTWEPYLADIAGSGDLGYTLGRYQFMPKDTTGGRSTSHGYYVTIWKKQLDGTWKFVLDTGVQGPADTTEVK